MIVPDPEDLPIGEILKQDFGGRKFMLFENPSPVLPLHYDKKYLPKNKCEKQYLGLFQCLAVRDFKKEETCAYQIKRFENCRKIRDIGILKSIKEWQSKHIYNLDKNNRQLYLQGLTFKLDRLKEQYGRMPSTQTKQFSLTQMESEIEQIKWRMKYIKKIID